MKKITFTKYQEGKAGRFFWHPWGCLGCLGRIITFLAIMMLIMWLLNMLHGCHENWVKKGESDPDVGTIKQIGEDDPITKIPIDTVNDWRKDIPDPGNNLPSPNDNYLPPINEDDIETGDDGRKIVSNRLNVILDSDANDETFKQWANEFKKLYPGNEYNIVFYDPNTKLLQIQVPASERELIMKKLPQQITDISFKIFPEGLLGPSASAKPNDPVFKNARLSWYFSPIQVFDAWNITEGDPNVTIAIVDSYFDLYHDDLNSNRIRHPYSVVKRNGNVAPDQGCDKISFLHGSMVASQALGNKNNARGTAGIAPKCAFIPVSLGSQPTSMTMLNGVLYAIYKGANVINISMGAVYDENVARLPIDNQVSISRQHGLEEQDVWDYVTDLANKRNVTLVWASGNEDVLTSLDPSKRNNCAIRVSAVNQKLAKADFSNFGNFREYNLEASTISAPGVDIFGAMPYNTYNIGPGTSFSAPIVTGAVALMKSLDPTLTNKEIIEILQETGKKPSDGCTSIGPIIQIKDALLKIQSSFVRLDDLLKDHNKLIGLWQSTELLTAFNQNGPTGELVRQYFEFPNPNRGTSIIYETGSKLDYNSQVNVTWSESSIEMTTGVHTSPSSPTGYVAIKIHCKPDKNGLLQCIQTSAEYGTGNPYFLKKVKSRKNE